MLWKISRSVIKDIKGCHCNTEVNPKTQATLTITVTQGRQIQLQVQDNFIFPFFLRKKIRTEDCQTAQCTSHQR